MLVGYETADDAGVYRLDDEHALVQTVDFFTPIVDDPHVYGQIAAANAVSDVYAMGAQPRFALSLVGFPEGKLEEAVLREILRGGASKLEEARVAIIGGHSVKDPELKFGYAVTGFARPEEIRTNRGAQPEDVLLLTKPLGTGVVATAIKAGRCPAEVAEEATRWMTLLNEAASLATRPRQVHAMTDVTGYGLAGHAFEIAMASGVCLVLEGERVPFVPGVEALASKGLIPGGVQSNRRYLGSSADWGSCPSQRRDVLLDPQTSGGLLISLPSSEADRLEEDLRSAGSFVARIGRVEQRGEVYLRVV